MRWFAWVMFSRPLIDEPSAFTLQALCCFVPPPPQPPPKKKKKKSNGFVSVVRGSAKSTSGGARGIAQQDRNVKIAKWHYFIRDTVIS